MPEPISDEEYWANRLKASWDTELHHSVFKCSIEKWRKIEDAHRVLLADTIGMEESVLDAGCGYGRLLSLLPRKWKGDYLGVDLSPAFIEFASKRYPKSEFVVGDLRNLPAEATRKKFDWAVVISIRPMVIRNLGREEWDKMESQLLSVASRILVLEYDTEFKEIIQRSEQ